MVVIFIQVHGTIRSTRRIGSQHQVALNRPLKYVPKVYRGSRNFCIIFVIKEFSNVTFKTRHTLDRKKSL